MFDEETMRTIRIILGAIILLSSIVINVFIPINKGLSVLLITTFGLLALSMNFKYEKSEGKEVVISERNAWDIWFYSMPGVILALFFAGILADDPEVWKWVAASLGGAVGLESLSSIIRSLRS